MSPVTPLKYTLRNYISQWLTLEKGEAARHLFQRLSLGTGLMRWDCCHAVKSGSWWWPLLGKSIELFWYKTDIRQPYKNFSTLEKICPELAAVVLWIYCWTRNSCPPMQQIQEYNGMKMNMLICAIMMKRRSYTLPPARRHATFDQTLDPGEISKLYCRL